MSKFTKTLTVSALALAVSGLTTGTAFAQTDVFQIYEGSKTTVDVSAKKCGKNKRENLDTRLALLETGPFQGEWLLDLFSFEEIKETSGVQIDSNPGTQKVMAYDDESFEKLVDLIDATLVAECSGALDRSTVNVSKFTVKFKKDTATIKMKMDGKYDREGKMQKVKLNLNGKTNLVDVGGTDPGGTD